MSDPHNNIGDTPEELYIRGIEYLHRQSCEQAVATFRKLILIDPSYKDAWQRLDEAKKKARKFEDLEDLYCASNVHLGQKQWKAAIVYLKPIVDSGEEYGDAVALLEEAEKRLELQSLYAEAEVQLVEGEWEQAIETLERIFSIDQTYKDSYAKLDEARAQYRLQSLEKQALRHFRRERWSQAIKDLNAILREDPDYPGAADKLKEAQKQQKLAALYSAAVGFQGTGNWEEAIDTYREIIQRVRVYKDVAARLGRVQRQQRLDRDQSGRIAFIEFLRDPVMQGVGVIVGVIGLVATVIVAIYTLVPGVFSSPATPTPTPKPVTLCNGGFEDSFECWQHGGALDQTVKCDGNDCYAVLGNPDYPCYYGVPVGEAWIKQTVRVQQVVSPTLSLRYRVFSYDLDLPDCDYFQVAINEEPLPQRYGNYEWVEPSCDGEPWDSDWQDVLLDLSDHRGEEIEISFHNVNGTQPYYNTWTYVDDVTLDEVH